MVKDKANPFLKIFITLCMVLFASYRTLCQNPKYDNLSFGIPGKADAIIDRLGYALGYRNDSIINPLQTDKLLIT